MLPHMTDQYIVGAADRIHSHQRQDVLASKAALYRMKKAGRAARRFSLKKLFNRRPTLEQLPQVGRQHS
jgi:hypothetical protein